MPYQFWEEAFTTVCYIINRIPTPILNNHSPFEVLFHKKPPYNFFHVFGCACWPCLRQYNNHKLEYRSKTCIFIGYSSCHRGYKCLDVSSGRVYVSKHVFNEHFFPYLTLSNMNSSSIVIASLPSDLSPLPCFKATNTFVQDTS